MVYNDQVYVRYSTKSLSQNILCILIDVRLIPWDEEHQFPGDIQVVGVGDAFNGTVYRKGQIKVILEVVEEDLCLTDSCVQGFVVITWKIKSYY